MLRTIVRQIQDILFPNSAVVVGGKHEKQHAAADSLPDGWVAVAAAGGGAAGAVATAARVGTGPGGGWATGGYSVPVVASASAACAVVAAAAAPAAAVDAAGDERVRTEALPHHSLYTHHFVSQGGRRALKEDVQHATKERGESLGVRVHRMPPVRS